MSDKTKQASRDRQSYYNLHKTCGYNVGDRVKILRVPSDSEHGWIDRNEEDLPVETNLIGVIEKDDGQQGFFIELDKKCQFMDGLYVPFYVLCMVKPYRTTIRNLDGNKVYYQAQGLHIKVGCQKVTTPQVEALLHELYWLQEEADLQDTSNANKNWSSTEQKRLDRNIERFIKRAAFIFKRTRGSIRIRLQQTLEGKFRVEKDR